jgi:Transposase DDE domain
MPQMYRDLLEQLRQWVNPKDPRHLQVYAESLGGILSSGSGCLSHWLPYLSHRDCQARSHLERLSYFLHNPLIEPAQYYAPIVTFLLQFWAGQALTLVIDSSMLWDEYCLIDVCLVWGGRSLPIAHLVLKHGSATVGFEQYRPVLEAALATLPVQVQVTLLADRGFMHGDLMRWLTVHKWDWAIRVKSDLLVRPTQGFQQSVAQFIPPSGQAYLFHHVQILEDVSCHLATANWPGAQEPWCVATSRPPSLKTFALYGQRFGGIEPHFKDYKSAGFGIIRSRVRDAQALTRLFMLLAVAQWLASLLGLAVFLSEQLTRIDWHGQRGLSFLQLGLRQIQRFQHLQKRLPRVQPLPYLSPPRAFASLKTKDKLHSLIDFHKVTIFLSA